MSKAPAFQFYTGDWLSSTAITLMTPAEEGAYIRLLAYMWNDPDCGLPENPEKLIALSRLTPADRGVIGSILACFEKHPSKKGFLTNKRLSEERKKQEEWRQHQREAGIKGMESRWSLKKKKHNKPITSLLPKHNPSSSSSSSSSINKEKDLSGKPDLADVVNEIINFLNTTAKREYKTSTPKTRALILTRIKEGFILEDFKKVINLKTAEWLKDAERSMYLRPETLFGTKFESYLNTPPPQNDWRNNPKGIKP